MDSRINKSTSELNTYMPRPRSKTIGARSNPGSRSVSPGRAMGRRGGERAEEEEEEEEEFVCVKNNGLECVEVCG